MKIAYLLGSLNRGGLETLMLDVCQNLQKTNFEAIGIYRKDGVMEELFLKSGVPFFKLEVGKSKLKYLLSLRKLILKNNVTIVHAQQPLDAIYAKLACIGTNVKIILTFHGFDFGAENKLLNYIIKKTDLNVYVSNYQCSHYVQKYGLNKSLQKVIYNGINFSKFEQNKDKTGNLRKELQVPETSLLLGMIGSFNVCRDQFSVCRFLKLLKQKREDFHFVFVGKRVDSVAERYDKCVEFCRDNELESRVSFLGMRNDVPEILSQLDAFIYSTEHDTFGIAVVEAIAAGIPVFVNDWDVMREITEDGKLVNLYKSKDEEDLLEKFMLFLQNKKAYKEQAVENAKMVRNKFGIEKHISELRTLYQSL